MCVSGGSPSNSKQEEDKERNMGYDNLVYEEWCAVKKEEKEKDKTVQPSAINVNMISMLGQDK